MEKLKEEMFRKIAEEVERDYGMGGLSHGLYCDYARDILERYLKNLEKDKKNVYKNPKNLQAKIDAIDKNITKNIDKIYDIGEENRILEVELMELREKIFNINNEI